jgi:outer membrane lipoprotein SlyB
MHLTRVRTAICNFGGIFGNRRRGAGRGAAIGAAFGAIAGGARQAQERNQLYDMAYADCMVGRIPY